MDSPNPGLHRVLKHGKIIASQGKWVIDVVIRELSLTGAHVILQAAVDLPAEFELVIATDGMRYPARKEWQKAAELGIAFTGLPRPVAGAAVDRSTTAIAAPLFGQARQQGEEPPQKLANFDRFPIQPDFELGYTRHPLYSDKGQCLVTVKLVNRGAIVAHQPFLCLPALGLRLEPVTGWSMQEIKGLRKMYRFSRLETADLEPDASFACCTIALPFTAARGGSLEFESGNHHALAAIPDLKVTCLAGAGNYSSERVPLIVPSADITAHIHALAQNGEIPLQVPEAENDVFAAAPGSLGAQRGNWN